MGFPILGMKEGMNPVKPREPQGLYRVGEAPEYKCHSEQRLDGAGSPGSQDRSVLVLRLGHRTWSRQEDQPWMFGWATERES